MEKYHHTHLMIVRVHSPSFSKMETIPPSGEFTTGAVSSVAAPPCTISSVMPAPPPWECSLSYFFKSVNAMPSWSALRSLRMIQRKSGSSEFASEISKRFLQLGHTLDTQEINFLCEICSELGMTPASFAAEWVLFTRNQPNARPSLSSLSSLCYLIEDVSEICECFLLIGHMLERPERIFLRVLCSEFGLTPASFATEWDSFTLNQPNARPSLFALGSLSSRIRTKESVVSSQKKLPDAVCKTADVASIPPSGEFTPGVVSSVAAPSGEATALGPSEVASEIS